MTRDESRTKFPFIQTAHASPPQLMSCLVLPKISLDFRASVATRVSWPLCSCLFIKETIIHRLPCGKWKWHSLNLYWIEVIILTGNILLPLSELVYVEMNNLPEAVSVAENIYLLLPKPILIFLKVQGTNSGFVTGQGRGEGHGLGFPFSAFMSTLPDQSLLNVTWYD